MELTTTELVLTASLTASWITAVVGVVGLRLAKTLSTLSHSLNATVLTASMDLSETMALETSKLNQMVGGIAEALGSIADVTQDDVKYIPLEDFITEKLLAEAQSDFDSSELVFEFEL